MRIHVLLVGKPHDSHARALHARYAARIAKLGASYDSAWVPEVRAGDRFSEDHAREREARLLGSKLDRSRPGHVIALDRTGRSWTSRELAARLVEWARPDATFVLGGPSGLHRSLLARANERWSLSRLTFPHELARVILAEQLYRALTLIRGLPYHR